MPVFWLILTMCRRLQAESFVCWEIEQRPSVSLSGACSASARLLGVAPRCPHFSQRLLLRLPSVLYHTSQMVLQKTTPFGLTQGGMHLNTMRRQPRVLHIVGDSEFGGGAWCIFSLVKMAQQHGLTAEVLSTDPKILAELRNRGIGAVPLAVIWRDTNPVRDLIGVFRLVRFLRTSPYSIVHTHTSKGGFIGRLAARIAGIPIIVHTAHGFAFHEFSSTAALQFYAALERIATHWCGRIITVSNNHREWALELKISLPEKIVAIQNGISPERLKVTRLRDQIRAELGVSSEEALIITLGRLVPQKGLEYLIQAVPDIVTQMGNRVKVIIAGRGPLRTDLEDLAYSIGVAANVTFIGFRADVADILNVADVVALPSLWEGLSIALLEAMAMAKPIVTTDISSNREVIEDGRTALLVPPRDPGTLAQAIVSLLSSPTLAARLGAAAQETFKAKFTEERMLKQTWEVYSELISRKLPHLSAMAEDPPQTKEGATR